MKKMSYFIGFVLVLACLTACAQTASQKIIGEWEGTDTHGDKAVLIFDKNGCASIIIGNEILGGRDMKGVGSVIYKVDASQTPIAMDVYIVDTEGEEILRTAWIVEFIADDEMRVRTFLNDTRPAGFKAAESEDTVCLSRVRK